MPPVGRGLGVPSLGGSGGGRDACRNRVAGLHQRQRGHEMLGTPAQHVRARCAVEYLTDFGVRAFTTQRRHLGQHFLAKQSVGERITVGARGRGDDAGIGSLVEMVGKRVDVEAGGGREQRHVDRVPDDGGHPEHLQHSRIEAGQPQAEDGPDCLRQFTGVAFVLGQARVFGDEQRIAARASDQAGDLRVGQGFVGDLIGQCCGIVIGQCRHDDLTIATSAGDRAEEPAERGPVLALAQSDDEAHRVPVHSGRHGGERAHRHRVGPLGIVDHDRQRCCRRTLFDDALYPVVRGEAGGVGVHAVLGGEDLGGVAAQRLDELTGGPPGGGALLGIAGPHGATTQGLHPLGGLVGEACLSDARRADQDEPARVPRDHLTEQPADVVDLARAAHEFAVRCGSRGRGRLIRDSFGFG